MAAVSSEVPVLSATMRAISAVSRLAAAALATVTRVAYRRCRVFDWNHVRNRLRAIADDLRASAFAPSLAMQPIRESGARSSEYERSAVPVNSASSAALSLPSSALIHTEAHGASGITLVVNSSRALDCECWLRSFRNQSHSPSDTPCTGG